MRIEIEDAHDQYLCNETIKCCNLNFRTLYLSRYISLDYIYVPHSMGLHPPYIAQYSISGQVSHNIIQQL